MSPPKVTALLTAAVRSPAIYNSSEGGVGWGGGGVNAPSPEALRAPAPG